MTLGLRSFALSLCSRLLRDIIDGILETPDALT
jgi:hypothetical protein